MLQKNKTKLRWIFLNQNIVNITVDPFAEQGGFFSKGGEDLTMKALYEDIFLRDPFLRSKSLQEVESILCLSETISQTWVESKWNITWHMKLETWEMKRTRYKVKTVDSFHCSKGVYPSSSYLFHPYVLFLISTLLYTPQGLSK